MSRTALEVLKEVNKSLILMTVNERIINYFDSIITLAESAAVPDFCPMDFIKFKSYHEKRLKFFHRGTLVSLKYLESLSNCFALSMIHCQSDDFAVMLDADKQLFQSSIAQAIKICFTIMMDDFSPHVIIKSRSSKVIDFQVKKHIKLSKAITLAERKDRY